MSLLSYNRRSTLSSITSVFICATRNLFLEEAIMNNSITVFRPITANRFRSETKEKLPILTSPLKPIIRPFLEKLNAS